MCFLDESVLYGIRQRVNHLFDRIVRIDQPHDTRLFGGPEILPSPTKRVLALRKKLVEVLEESWVVTGRVIDACVMVVAHRDGEQHVDSKSGRCFAETVHERVVR